MFRNELPTPQQRAVARLDSLIVDLSRPDILSGKPPNRAAAEHTMSVLMMMTNLADPNYFFHDIST